MNAPLNGNLLAWQIMMYKSLDYHFEIDETDSAAAIKVIVSMSKV